MIIKVCGMREAENIRHVEALGIDYMGFIFYPKSPRYVPAVPAYLPERTKRVGVFVDAATPVIMAHIAAFRLHVVQLHGKETPQQCRKIHDEATKLFGSAPLIWKAVSVATAADLSECSLYEDVANGLVFDTKCTSYGGSGEQYDWDILSAYNGNQPFLLSGGIGPDDADRIIRFRHPRLAGIDLNSRFESAPALKDTRQLEHFIQTIRTNQHLL